MSHIVKAKLSINNESVLKKALTRMGLNYEEGEFALTGTNQKVQLLLERDHLGLQRQQDQSFMLVGDPYYCQNAKLRKYYNHVEQFDRDVKTAYAVVETTEQLETMGFVCTDNAEGKVKNNKVRMVFQSLCD